MPREGQPIMFESAWQSKRLTINFLAITFAVGIVWVRLRAEDGTSKGRQAATDTPSAKASKAALSQYQDLIGGWLGTGQPKRGSATGAWRERAEWRWKFDRDGVTIEYTVEEGKLLKSASLSYDSAKKSFRLKTNELTEAKDEVVEREYQGTASGNKLVLESPSKVESDGRRITITRLNEKRTLVLFERKAPSQNFYTRVAEVGYTREGTRLAESDQTGPECVVTGGAGTIKVTYKGETYWVCCTGCRDAFNDDPEGILADYKKKLEERKPKK
jgi:YHS domain-containing protein